MKVYVDDNAYKPFGSPEGFSFVEDIVLDFDTNEGKIITKRIVQKEEEYYAYTFEIKNGLIIPEDTIELVKVKPINKVVYEDYA